MGQLSFDTPTDDTAPVLMARLLFEEPVGLLDYRVPEHLVDTVVPGTAVRVPLRRREVGGYVVKVVHELPPEGISLKDIIDVDSDRTRLPEGLMRLIIFGSEYYGAPPSDVLAAALPASARRASTRYEITDRGRAVLNGQLAVH